jgi:predicted dehydrogenase
MTDSIGVAVIGAGMAGRSHAHAYRTAQTVFGADASPVRLVAIADVNTGIGATTLQTPTRRPAGATRVHSVRERLPISAVTLST